MTRSRAIAVSSLIGSVVLWSASLSVVSIAVEGASPGSVTFWRCVVGALVLTVWLLMTRRGDRSAAGSARPTVQRSDWRWIAVSGLSCGIAFLLIAHGMQRVGSGPAGIVMSSIPALTMLLVAIERPHAGVQVRHLLSLGIGGAGVLLLMLPDGGSWNLLGIVALGLAATSQAVTNVASAHALTRADPVLVAAASMAFAALVSLPMADLGSVPSGSSLVAIIVLGVLPTGAAYVLFFSGVRTLGATQAAFSNFLVPPVAVVAGLVLLGEVPDARTVIALGLATAALAIGLGGRSGVLADGQYELATSVPRADLAQRT